MPNKELQSHRRREEKRTFYLLNQIFDELNGNVEYLIQSS